MATAADVATLRDLLNEPDDSNGWTDEKLAAIIDGNTTMNGAAARGWSLKAARYSELVNVSESGSSRSLGDLFSRAMQMAAYYRGLDEQEAPPVDAGIVIARVRRGFS